MDNVVIVIALVLLVLAFLLIFPLLICSILSVWCDVYYCIFPRSVSKRKTDRPISEWSKEK